MNFDNLKMILEMDFSQMRVLQCEGGRCASDEAIFTFIDNLIAFFSQPGRPTQADLETYVRYMTEITNQINKSEYQYYLAKYNVENPEYAEQLAVGSKLKSFKDIPTRMQYWAASKEWGESIRNSKNHVCVAKHLSDWARLSEGLNTNRHFNRKSSNDDLIIRRKRNDDNDDFENDLN